MNIFKKINDAFIYLYDNFVELKNKYNENFYLIDSYFDQNTMNYYKIYNNNWCEQGIFTSSIANAGQINLLVPYKDINYVGNCTQITSNYAYSYVSIYNRNTTYFNVTIVAGSSGVSSSAIFSELKGFIE